MIEVQIQSVSDIIKKNSERARKDIEFRKAPARSVPRSLYSSFLFSAKAWQMPMGNLQAGHESKSYVATQKLEVPFSYHG